MHRARMIVAALLSLLVAACSARSAIDKLSSPEDRAFAQSFVDRVRGGDIKALQPMFAPAAWEESASELERARTYFPPTPGTTELISYSYRGSTANGVSRSSRSYILVTHDGTHWTTTRVNTQTEANGPQLIFGWNINGSPEMPAEYRFFRAMDGFAKGAMIGAIIVLIIIVSLIIWLVRRSRRRRDPLMGQDS